MKYFSVVIIAFSLVFSVKGQAQLPDCTNPQEVKLSVYENRENAWNKNDDGSNSIYFVEDTLETIYYQEEDAYTFWYKLTVDGPEDIMYTLRKFDRDDEYEVMYYEYKGRNFCNDLMKQKVKPKSGSVFKVHQILAIILVCYTFLEKVADIKWSSVLFFILNIILLFKILA